MHDAQSRFISLRGFIFLSAGVVALGLLLWWLTVRAYPSLQDRASFGSIFGGTNALYAALAFAALTFTLLLQQHALSLQREQLGEQREELARKEANARQQAFETMLVQLIGFHYEISKALALPERAGHLEGRRALRTLADEMNGAVANVARERPNAPSIVVAQAAYDRFRTRSRGILDHYFRNLYQIIKFIDSSPVADKRRYTSLVRAQLSPDELLLLFYDGVSPLGEKFKPLIERYGLLEHLPDGAIPRSRSHADWRFDALRQRGHTRGPEEARCARVAFRMSRSSRPCARRRPGRPWRRSAGS